METNELLGIVFRHGKYVASSRKIAENFKVYHSWLLRVATEQAFTDRGISIEGNYTMDEVYRVTLFIDSTGFQILSSNVFKNNKQDLQFQYIRKFKELDDIAANCLKDVSYMDEALNKVPVPTIGVTSSREDREAAKLLLEVITQNPGLSEGEKSILLHKQVELICGKDILFEEYPTEDSTPKISKPKGYTSATNAGIVLGVTPKTIGVLANYFGLKSPLYGIKDKVYVKSLGKQVELFRYTPEALRILSRLVSIGAQNYIPKDKVEEDSVEY